MAIVRSFFGVFRLLLPIPVLGLVVPAHAQLVTADQSGESAKVIRDYAKCVVRGTPNEARRQVLAGGVDDTNSRHRLIRPDCLEGRPGSWVVARFPGDLYLYALAEAVVTMDYPRDPGVDLKSAPPIAHRTARDRPMDTAAQAAWRSGLTGERGRMAEDARATFASNEANQVFLSRYGECVVRNDTTDAHALLASIPFSTGELAAWTALQPILGACMAGADQVKMGKTALRGAIAMNYYRLASGAGVPHSGRS